MNFRTLRFFVLAAITAWLAVAGSTATATVCPASPNYLTDFNSNQNCIVRNGSAQFFPYAGTPKVLRLNPASSTTTGSAWFNTKQPVANGFSTTFQFKFSNPSDVPADGIAFVIQNSGLQAIGYTGGNGGTLGYGDRDVSNNPSTGEGIPGSIAIEFDSFQNGWDADANHVAIQSCGTGPNTSHHGQPCQGEGGANSTLARTSVSSPIFADGLVHKVTVSYTPPDCSDCSGKLHVILDDTELFPGGVSVTLDSLLGLSEGSAYVGFTGATGGKWENQDILNWTFTPTAQSAPVTTAETTVLSFQNNAYTYEGQLKAGDPVTVQVTPILMDPTACDNLVQGTYAGAKCIVFANAAGSGQEKAVLFELTCPQSASNPECNPFDADLGTTFELGINNPGFNPSSPFPGWLKGRGPDAAHPCAAAVGNTPALFKSNQVSSFFLTATDPKTKGGSGGTGSCWVATYNQPDEVPPAIAISSPTNTTYTLNQEVVASYTCSDPTSSKPASNPTGPYLTTASCQQSTDAEPPSTASCSQTATGVSCTGSVDTSMPGTHSFVVTARDTGKNTSTSTVKYTVLSPNADLAILNVGLAKIATGKKLTYAIGATNFGPNPAMDVKVTNPLPAGTSFVNGSGSNISCAVVNRRLSCTTTSFTCSAAAGVVTCNLGSLAPLTWSALNGAVLQINVQVNAAAGTTLKDTATISSSNADPKTGNNSSTVTTQVTAH